MRRIKEFKRYIRQILAITEKNLFLQLRYKANIVTRFLNPIIQLVLFIFIFRIIFKYNQDVKIGYWDGNTYILFLLLAFVVQFSTSIISRYREMFVAEKYWNTLSATLVAPVNRFIILLGVIFSELIIISIPLLFLFIITFILYPIPLLYLFLVLLIYFSIILIFGGIGLIIGVFAISNEEWVPYSLILIRLILLFSCINYPVQIFPEFFQVFVKLNPLYYLFDLFKLTWYMGLDFENAISYITINHIISLILLTILTPIVSLYLFERIYKKYGITGY